MFISLGWLFKLFITISIILIISSTFTPAVSRISFSKPEFRRKCLNLEINSLAEIDLSPLKTLNPKMNTSQNFFTSFRLSNPGSLLVVITKLNIQFSIISLFPLLSALQIYITENMIFLQAKAIYSSDESSTASSSSAMFSFYPTSSHFSISFKIRSLRSSYMSLVGTSLLRDPASCRGSTDLKFPTIGFISLFQTVII